MEDTQYSIDVKSVIDKIYKCIRRVNKLVSLDVAYDTSIVVLYAFHKGYKINVSGMSEYEFLPTDDSLFEELVKLVHKDVFVSKLIYFLVQELSLIDLVLLDSVYLDVIRYILHLKNENSKEPEDLLIPDEIAKLLAYFVKSEKCNSIYDPFCGAAPYLYELVSSDNVIHFVGQENDSKTSLFAKLVLEASDNIYGDIKVCDSVEVWNRQNFDAVVSCHPFRIGLTPSQKTKSESLFPECPCNNYEDLILHRAFYCNHARLTVMLLPTSFCHGGYQNYKFRKYLIERNLVDTIVSIPSNLLYGNSLSCVILVCKSHRNLLDPIKFIHVEDYFLGDKKTRVFDYERSISMIEGDAIDCSYISVNDVRDFNYNLNPSLYYNRESELESGQQIVRLKNLISPVVGSSIPSESVSEMILTGLLSRNFIDILLNDGKFRVITDRNIGNCVIIRGESEKYLLEFNIDGTIKYGLYTKGKEFVCQSLINVYKINESLVTPEYLVYLLVNHKEIRISKMSLFDLMMLKVVIDDFNHQNEIVNKEKQCYNQKRIAEQEADAKRLGVKQNISDLEHMLGSTQLRINKIISRLEKISPDSDNYQKSVKSLKDNVLYLNRVIKYSNARIDADSFNLKKGNIADFIESYESSWNNYGDGYFKLNIINQLIPVPEMSFDKILLTVMLDSILDNAIRHGFHKRKDYTENNTVQIRLSMVVYQEHPYVLLSVANNGEPMNDNFTIEDYISKGRYTSQTGRSGLGGYHVYQIVKGHNGFLCLDSNKKWNAIVDVLLPVEDTELNNFPAYENECI